MAIAQFFGGLAEEFGKTLKMGAILEAKQGQARRQEEHQFKLLERESELQSKRLFQKQEFDRETKLAVSREEAMQETKLLKEMYDLGTKRLKQIKNWGEKRFPEENIDVSDVDPLTLQEFDMQSGGIEQVMDTNPEGGKQAMTAIGFRFVPKVTLGEKGGVSVSLQRLQPGEKLTPEGFRVAGELGLPRFTDQWSEAHFAKFNAAMEAKAEKAAARGRAPEAEIERISKKVGAEGLSSLSEGEMRVWVQNKGLNKEVQFAIQDARAAVESDINMLTASTQEKDAAVWEKAIRNLDDRNFYRSIQMPFPSDKVRSQGIEQLQEQMRVHGFLETAPKKAPEKKEPTLKIESPLERLRKRHLRGE